MRVVTKSVTDVEKDVGEAWDGLDIPGKKAIMDGGGEAIKLSAAEDAKWSLGWRVKREPSIKHVHSPSRSPHNGHFPAWSGMGLPQKRHGRLSWSRKAPEEAIASETWSRERDVHSTAKAPPQRGHCAGPS